MLSFFFQETFALFIVIINNNKIFCDSNKHKQWIKFVKYIWQYNRGVSRIFERGGPISLGSLKKRSSDFKRGGVKWSDGGGPAH